MLFTDIAHGHESAVGVANGVTEDALGFKDPVRKLRDDLYSALQKAIAAANPILILEEQPAKPITVPESEDTGELSAASIRLGED